MDCTPMPLRPAGGLSRLIARALMAAVVGSVFSTVATAQGVPAWAVDPGQTTAPPVTEPPATDQAPAAAPPGTAPAAPGNLTVVPRSGGDDQRGGASANATPVQLVALLTADGQQIDQGVVWRVYRDPGQADQKATLVSTVREPAPVVQLDPGRYVVNAAFGRAHLTRRINVAANATTPAIEQFVLNAGGLRVTTIAGGKAASAGAATYSIYSDRDQTDSRKLIIAGVKPGMIVRLNAGIYHVVSTYGDANAIVRSDVTVEAGKLSEATLVHTTAKVTLKLVLRTGGEAIPETYWTIRTVKGEIVKESVGALPSHTLAPGNYSAVAKWQGKGFRKDFAVRDGDKAQIEVVTQ